MRSLSKLDLDPEVPSIDESEQKPTIAAQIQFAVENGEWDVENMGKNYENRRNRLTARLIGVYGWDGAKAWFDEYWDTEEKWIIVQMKKVSIRWDYLPDPKD